jgi:hypothetical protein
MTIIPLTALTEPTCLTNALTGNLPTELGLPFKMKVISIGENSFPEKFLNILSFPFLKFARFKQRREPKLLLTGHGKARNRSSAPVSI